MLKNTIQYFLELFYPLFRKLMTYEVYAYLAVGGANTVFNILLFALLYQFVLPEAGIMLYKFHFESYTISLVVAFLATVPTGFWLAKHFAFKVNRNHGKTHNQLFKYFIVVLQGLGADYLLLLALITIVGLHPTVAKIFSTVIVVTVNFLLQKYFTFGLKTTWESF